MATILRIGAVNYANALPLIWGMEKHQFCIPHELVLDHPAHLFERLKSGDIHLALVSSIVAKMMPSFRNQSRFGIAADGYVHSVGLFANEPLHDIHTVYLDSQSLSSVALTRVLFARFWQQPVTFLASQDGEIPALSVGQAAVIIGDRALECKTQFRFYVDLAEAWQSFCGKPFIFARWLSYHNIPTEFLSEFDAFQEYNLRKNVQEIISTRLQGVALCDWHTYYTKFIRYELTAVFDEGENTFFDIAKEFL